METLAGSLEKSVLRLPRIFRDAGIVQDLNSGRRAKVGPVLQNPDNFLAWCYLHKLRAFPVPAARADDRVAVGQTGGALGIDEPIGLRKIVRHIGRALAL